MAPNDYAILVGISHYPGLRHLAGPEHDVRHMQEWLTSATGGNVPSENIETLVSSRYPDDTHIHRACPMVDDVNEACEKLILRGADNDGNVGRRLYIFLAGHGIAPDVEEVALLMANARQWALGHHIPGRLYANWFRTEALFEEVILFMDCCRDKRPHVPKNLPPWDTGIYGQTRGVVVRHFYGFATQWSHKAYECPAPTAVKGRFTHVLLEGLQGGARDRYGRITAHSLRTFIREQFSQLAPSWHGGYQEPTFEYDQEIIFVDQVQPLQTHVCIRFLNDAIGRQAEIRGGDLQLIAHHLIQNATWDITLPPGLYRVHIPSAGRSALFQVLAERELDVTC